MLDIIEETRGFLTYPISRAAFSTNSRVLDETIADPRMASDTALLEMPSLFAMSASDVFLPVIKYGKLCAH